MSNEELIDLQKWLEQKNALEKELKYLTENPSNPEFEGLDELLKEEIAYTRKVISIINLAIQFRASETCIERMVGVVQA
jgi:hypothetical protein